MLVKKLLLLFVLTSLTFGAKAGHELGGMIITYRSAPGPSNDPLRYEIIAYSVYDNSGIAPPTSSNVAISSGCFPNQTVQVSRIGTSGGSLTTLSGLDYCTGTVSGSISLSMAIFKGFVTLPGTCADFRFYGSSCCGRYTNMINITPNFSGSDYFYADLNNLNGPNSTPELNVTDFIRFACPNKPLNIYSFTEADGDSVVYTPSAPTYQSGSSFTNHTYSAGYSISNPVGSTTGYSLNASTGAVQTQVPSGGQYAITIMYEEYRPDLGGTFIKISEGRFTPVLGIANSCTLPSFDMVYAPVLNADSVDCGAQTLRLSATRKISIASLSTNGSEFLVSSMQKGSMTVSGVQLIQDSIVELTFTQPVASNDVLLVYLQTGSDGDAVVSVCGQELPVGSANGLLYYSPNIPSAVASITPTNTFLNVSFSSSGSNGNSFIWDFGDGSPSSSDPNPNHTYTMAGQYTVTLVVLNSCGEGDTAIQLVDVCDVVSVSGFTVNQTGNTVNLTPTGVSGASSLSWIMGDGAVLNGMTGINHTYANEGSYIVKLVAVNDCGDADTVTQTIDICAPLSADFGSMQTGNIVAFDGSLSSSGATAYYWNLGDGSSATGANYVHTYSTLGNYYVTLTVVNACMDSAVFGDTIKLCLPAIPSWTYQITSSGSNGMVVQFDASNSQNAVSYQWDFGDGSGGSGVNPQHTYSTVSLSYLVQLTVTNACSEQGSYAYRLSQIGLDELHASEKIELYPNPASEKLHLSWQAENISPERITLFTSAGQRVFEHQVTPDQQGEVKIELNISDLPAGLYHLQLEGEHIFIRERVLIQP